MKCHYFDFSEHYILKIYGYYLKKVHSTKLHIYKMYNFDQRDLSFNNNYA